MQFCQYLSLTFLTSLYNLRRYSFCLVIFLLNAIIQGGVSVPAIVQLSYVLQSLVCLKFRNSDSFVYLIICFTASFYSIIEGRLPQLSMTSPEGDYVCPNKDTILVCSFDEPEMITSVVWNIPERTNVDLSSYAGHEVNSTMMSEGYVTVTISSFSHLRDFYECSVLYSGPRSMEVSSRYLANPCMCNVISIHY